MANPSGNTFTDPTSNGDYFNVGSIVSVTTSSNVTHKGEIIAFDPKTKILILKMPSSSKHGACNLSDVHMINLNMVSDIRVHSEAKGPPEPLPDLNIHKLNKRLKEQIEKKKRLLMAYKAGISPEGQSLFRAISKTLDEVSWKDDNIIVMGSVTIAPPYKPENVKGNKESRAYGHIKKIVEKHVNEENASSESSVVGNSSNSSHSKYFKEESNARNPENHHRSNRNGIRNHRDSKQLQYNNNL